MRFNFVTIYNTRTLSTLSRAGALVGSRTKSLIWRLVGAAISLYMFYMAAMALFVLEGMAVFGVIYLLCALAAGAWTLFVYRIRGWYIQRMFLKGPQEQKAFFKEDNYEIIAGEDHAVGEYGDLWKIGQSKDYFLLFLGKNVGHILAKAGMTGGTPEQFQAFLEEKTGKEMLQLKL